MAVIKSEMFQQLWGGIQVCTFKYSWWEFIIAVVMGNCMTVSQKIKHRIPILVIHNTHVPKRIKTIIQTKAYKQLFKAALS
jgi:hypothetical protein